MHTAQARARAWWWDTQLLAVQGDVLVAEMLHKFLKAPGGQRQLLCCLIHRVAPIKDTATRLRRGMTKKERLDAWSRQNITLHKTHLGMAIQVGTSALPLLPAAGKAWIERCCPCPVLCLVSDGATQVCCCCCCST